MHLIPGTFLVAVATILDFGQRKYNPWDWANGMAWSKYFSACIRHMYAWWGKNEPTRTNFLFGELDTETGYSHLWHAACCILILICYEDWQKGQDDRYDYKN